MFCALIAGFAFFVNLSLIIWASTKGFKRGIATIQEGDCNETKRLDLWLHLGINFLSSLLLGASNYTMQCLSAPTRDEISKAHRQQITMDIGIPSVRNLRRISWRRISLWWLIALSSAPLHFMYNSAVFSTLSTHPYTAAVVSHDFLTHAPFSDMASSAYINNSDNAARQLITSVALVDVQRLTALRDNRSTLQNLSNDACLKAYRRELVPDRIDVLAVSSATKSTTDDWNSSLSLLSYWPDNVLTSTRENRLGGWSPYQWTCTETLPYRCSSPTRNWTVLDSPIDYCLSQHTEPSCKLQLSLMIMIIVTFCNFAKILCMSFTIWKPSSTPLLTLGDAIASFLDQPDPNTAKNSLAYKFRFRVVKHPYSDTPHCSSSSAFSKRGLDSHVTNDGSVERSQHRQASWDADEAIRTSRPERYRWYHSTSPAHWILSIFL